MFAVSTRPRRRSGSHACWRLPVSPPPIPRPRMPPYGDQGPARRPHAVVARGPLRHVHPLGPVQRSRRHLPWQADRRHRRMDHEQRRNPRGRIRRLCQAIQPREVQRRRVGFHRQERRHEVHRHHLEASRRLRDVPLEGKSVQHRRRHAVRRDPLKELAAACKKQGIKLGFYYSQAQDWHHPGGFAYSTTAASRAIGTRPRTAIFTSTSARSPFPRSAKSSPTTATWPCSGGTRPPA